jgi:hypothetical protein
LALLLLLLPIGNLNAAQPEGTTPGDAAALNRTIGRGIILGKGL